MIHLVIPPSPFLMDQKVFMNLGILGIAAVLRDAGVPITLTDFAEQGVDIPEGDLYGITATTPQIPSAVRIAERIKSLNPKARVILGGAHATMTYASKADRAKQAQRTLEEIFDTIVVGDGERAIFEAMKPGAPKLIIGAAIKDQDSLPIPSRDLVHGYHYTIDGHKATSVISQLGCPFGCGFCCGRNSSFFRKTRSRSVDKVVDELEHLYETYGYTGFMFFDDELNVNPEFIPMLEAIAELQHKLGVRFGLRGFIKAELFTEEQAKVMVAAGFKWILTGFESGSPMILKTMRKTAGVAENDRCVEIARKYGLKVKALMSIGHPGESEETVRETREWLLKVRPDEFDVTIITPYPGSPYYDDAVKLPDGRYCYTNHEKLYMQDLDYMKVMDFYKSSPGSYKCYVSTDYMEPARIIELRDSLELDVKSILYGEAIECSIKNE
jgi:radical SAM superfamily enzyme YgiQ (UPF0313 family)